MLLEPRIVTRVLHQLSERYCILRELGEGGQGKVFLVFNNALQQESCLKFASSEAPLATEACLLEKLNHTFFPAPRAFFALDVRVPGESARKVWVLERPYIEGITLEACLEYILLGHPAPKETVVSWGVQLCQLLDILHGWRKGPIIFRDLKPDNILLDSKGHVHLIDFGAATVGCATEVPLVGTIPYLAPEYVEHRILTPETDVYALGVTLYEMLGGPLPIACRTPDSHGHQCLCTASTFILEPLEVAGELGRCVWTLLDKGRPATAREALVRLTALLD